MSAPHRILFVCHGNICRSTMAEFVMKDLVSRRGMANAFVIGSAATHDDEIGAGHRLLRQDRPSPAPRRC